MEKVAAAARRRFAQASAKQMLYRRPDFIAGFGLLGITELAGFMNVFSGDADIAGGRDVPLRNIPQLLTAVFMDLAAILRGVVFLGQPHLSPRAERMPKGDQKNPVYLGRYVRAQAGDAAAPSSTR